MSYRAFGMLVGPFRVAGFYLYNLMFRVPRARVLVWNEHNELLLVRNWGGRRQWSLPGGGVKRSEQHIEAARRELYEEIGLDIPLAEFTYVTTLNAQYEAPIFSVSIVKSLLPKDSHNPREITDLRWFSVDTLPSDLSPLVPPALKKLSKAK